MSLSGNGLARVMRILLTAVLVAGIMPRVAWADEDLQEDSVSDAVEFTESTAPEASDSGIISVPEEWEALSSSEDGSVTIVHEGAAIADEEEAAIAIEDKDEVAYGPTVEREEEKESFADSAFALGSGGSSREAVASSFVFDGLSYSFSDGVLTITGSGMIPGWAFLVDYDPCYGFQSDSVAWETAQAWVASGIRQIVVGPGVTEVGMCAFQDYQGTMSELVSVDMSDSDIVTIGNGAFADAANLSSIKLPSTVTTINAGAFSGCSLPATFALPPRVSNLTKDILDNSGVKVVTHPDWTLVTETIRNQLTAAGLTLENGDPAGPFGTVGDPYIDEPEPDDKEGIELPEEGGFTYKDAFFAWEVNGSVLYLKRLGNPDNWTAAAPFDCNDGKTALLQVVTSGNGASITTIEFGDGISEIPDEFASQYLNIWQQKVPYTPNVTTVKLSASVTTVGIRAFNQVMTTLTTVEIPAGSNLTTINNGAFGAPHIDELDLSTTKITTLGGASAPTFTLPYDRIKFPSTLTTFKYNAFASTCMSLDDKTGVLAIPDSVTTVEAGAFAANESFLGDVDTITIPAKCDFSPAAFNGSIDALLVKRGSPLPTKDPAEVQVRGTWTKDTAFVQLTEGTKAKTLLYADYDLTGVVPADALGDKAVRTGDEVEALLASLGGEQSAGELGPALYSAYYRESTGADVDGLTLEDIILHRETIGHGKMLKVSDASGRVTAVDVTDLLNDSGSLSIDKVMQGVDMAGATAGGFPFASWTWELLLDDGTSEVTGTPTVEQVRTGMFGVRAKWGGETTAPTTPTTPPTTPTQPTVPDAPAAPTTPPAPTTPSAPLPSTGSTGSGTGSTGAATPYRGSLGTGVQRLGGATATTVTGSATGTAAATDQTSADGAAVAADENAAAATAASGESSSKLPNAGASSARADTGGAAGAAASPGAYDIGDIHDVTVFPWWWVLIPCLLIALIVGGAGGYVWGSRRSSDRERYEERCA